MTHDELLFSLMHADTQGYKIGYIFKPNHYNIHYVKSFTINETTGCYKTNFTRNKDEALIDRDSQKMEDAIVKIVSQIDEDDHYCWTPVIIDVALNSYKRFMNRDWNNSERKKVL